MAKSGQCTLTLNKPSSQRWHDYETTGSISTSFPHPKPFSDKDRFIICVDNFPTILLNNKAIRGDR